MVCSLCRESSSKFQKQEETVVKVTILEKPEGGNWSQVEVNAMIRGRVEVSELPSMPRRLVAENKPLDGRTFQQVLGHSGFAEREVEYRDRFAP